MPLLDLLSDQKWEDAEIILVDDGSTDLLSDVLEEFEDTGIRVLRHMENQGVSAARNTGLLAATGEYVLFLDCDDKVDAHMIKTLSGAVAEAQEADLILFGYQLDFPTSHQSVSIFDQHTYPIRREFEMEKDGGALFEILLQYNLWSPAFNVLVKRSLLMEKQILFDEAFSGCHEDELWKCDVLQAAKKAALLPDILYYAYISMEETCATKFHAQELSASFRAYEKKRGIVGQYGNAGLIRILDGLWIKQLMLVFANMAFHPESSYGREALLKEIEGLLNHEMFVRAYSNAKEHAVLLRFFARLLRKKDMSQASMQSTSFVLVFFDALLKLYQDADVSLEMYYEIKEALEKSILDPRNQYCFGMEYYKNMLYIYLYWTEEQVLQQVEDLRQRREQSGGAAFAN